MCVCLRGREKLPSRSCCTSERLKERQREGLHTLTHMRTHTHIGRNSIDREGNKITGGFGGKTNQRDVKGERGMERGRQRDKGSKRGREGKKERGGQVGLLHDRMRIFS